MFKLRSSQRRRVGGLLSAAAMMAASIPTALAQRAQLIGLGYVDPDVPISHAYAVSADGWVAGGDFARGFFQGDSFRWNAEEGMVELGLINSTAEGVSAHGDVIVGSGSGEAYRWTAETGIVLLGDLPGNEHSSKAWAVSGDGSVVVGQASSERSENREAFRWTPEEGMVALGDLDGGGFYSLATGTTYDGRIIVGQGRRFPDDEVWYWTRKTGMVGIGVPDGWRNTRFPRISPEGGVIVGYGEVRDVGFEPFRWTSKEGFVPLGVLDERPFEYYGRPYGASANGWVIVGNSQAVEGRRAAVWTPRRGVLNLNDLLQNEFGIELDDWVLSDANAVSYDGKTIVGAGPRLESGPPRIHEAFLARIPCIDDCDQCSFTEQMEATCAPQEDGTVMVTARLTDAKPGATLTFVLDYWKKMKGRTVRADGTARVKFKRQDPVPPLGTYHVTLKECDAPADAACR